VNVAVGSEFTGDLSAGSTTDYIQIWRRIDSGAPATDFKALPSDGAKFGGVTGIYTFIDTDPELSTGVYYQYKAVVVRNGTQLGNIGSSSVPTTITNSLTWTDSARFIVVNDGTGDNSGGVGSSRTLRFTFDGSRWDTWRAQNLGGAQLKVRVSDGASHYPADSITTGDPLYSTTTGLEIKLDGWGNEVLVATFFIPGTGAGAGAVISGGNVSVEYGYEDTNYPYNFHQLGSTVTAYIKAP
jgi:hypothetical protein